MSTSLIKIAGHVENYHWGKKGRASVISEFLNEVDNNSYYAELWFGAHQRAPSPLSTDRTQNLKHLIDKNPAVILGESVTLKFKNELPFLFKILSIEKPLSIQLHPDKINAADLHKIDPKNYPDSNHKPEIAVALSELHLVFGFRPVSEIKKVLRKNPEFHIFMDKSLPYELNQCLKRNNPKEFIQKIYTAVLHANKSDYCRASEALDARIKEYKKPNRHEKLVLEIINQYGYSDLAVFSVLLMNYGVLQPGQAVFIGPNKLHAYLKGDLIECMANSDNVIRAGMTPKFQDIKQLERLVEFDMQSFIPLKSSTSKNGLEITNYPASCNEFELSVIKGSGTRKYKNKFNLPFLFICLNGDVTVKTNSSETNIRKGEACLVEAVNIDFSLDCDDCHLACVTVPKY